MDGYIFGKNIKLILVCSLYFLEEKMLENKQFYKKYAKMAGKCELYDVISVLGAFWSIWKWPIKVACIAEQIKATNKVK